MSEGPFSTDLGCCFNILQTVRNTAHKPCRTEKYCSINRFFKLRSRYHWCCQEGSCLISVILPFFCVFFFCHEWNPTSFTVLFRTLLVALLLNHIGGTNLLKISYSSNHRREEVGRTNHQLKAGSARMPRSGLHPDRFWVSPRTEWPILVIENPHCWSFFFPVLQIVPTASCPFTEHCLPLSSLLPHQEFIHLTYGYNPPGSLFPQAEQSQLSQPQFHCVSDAPSSSSSKQPFAGFTPVHPRLSGTGEPSTDTALQLWPQQNSEEKHPPPLICWHCSS